MADELKDILVQLKTDVAAVTNVNRAILGQPMDALAEATYAKPIAAVYMTSGAPLNDTYAATQERHRIEMRFYWLLTPMNSEKVELNMASMWDLLMEKFFDSDGDRNLSENCTIALIGGETGNQAYQAAYERIGGKMHRILIVPIEVILHTHSV